MNRLRIPILGCLTALALALPASADNHKGHDSHPWPEDWAPELESLTQRDLRILPLRRAAEIVQSRFRGRLIAARLMPPRPDERARGVVLVHELRLLTPSRDVLVVRLDAHDGKFLEVAGKGLTKARRKDEDR